jgi:hypothetical protein
MIAQTLTTSFKTQLLTATHDFTPSTGDVFKMALYLPTASIGADTTVYTATGEITGTGYTAGGKTLTVIPPSSDDQTAYVSFLPAIWNPASFTTRGALIYNSTTGSAVAVLNFGSDKTATNTFTITFPTNSASDAIIRLSN